MQVSNVMLRAYFNDRAAIWDETIAEKDVNKLVQMAERLGLGSATTVLDVGTGTGVFLPYVLDLIGIDGRLIAIDIAEQMLLRARGKDFQGDISYLCADITSLPLAGEIFDAVVCYSSFPHFQNKLQALREVYRVVRHDGRLFICHTSSRAHINEMHGQIETVKHDTIPDADEMRSLLSAVGFVNIAIEDDGDSYLVYASKSQ